MFLSLAKALKLEKIFHEKSFTKICHSLAILNHRFRHLCTKLTQLGCNSNSRLAEVIVCMYVVFNFIYFTVKTFQLNTLPRNVVKFSFLTIILSLVLIISFAAVISHLYD